MLLFSTVLSINKSMTKDDFIKLVIEWNQSSPHRENVIENINWNGERNIRFGDEFLWLDIEEYRNGDIIAVRFEKCEANGAIWDSDYVMNFNDMKMAVRLDRSYTDDAMMDDFKFSTPHLITLLIDRGYLEEDGDLPVARFPHKINEDNIKCLADIINGKKKHRLPVVYVSKTPYDKDPVDINKLSKRLKGVAHVLVQASTTTNHIIKNMCGARNEYNGAIGIYYPNQTLRHRQYRYRSSVGYDSSLLEKVIRSVIQYSNAQLIDTLYTWQGVNNALLRDRLQAQREERLAAENARKKAEEETERILDAIDETERTIRKKAYDDAQTEANTLIASVDDDMQRLQKQIEDLTKANEILQYENQGLKAKLDSGDSLPLLMMGDEDDFYQGEIKDMVLSTLENAVSNLPKNTRRADVLNDIIRRNDFKHLGDKKKQKIKDLLKGYDGLKNSLKQELIALGFEIKEDGKHYKLTYFGDERYSTILAKTPSDHREGKNGATDICRNML